MILKRIKRFLRPYKFKALGTNSIVSEGKFFGQENISIGKACYVGPEAYWYGAGGIVIGDGTIFGPQSVVWSANHDYESKLLVPYDSGITNKQVVIGKACWIGFGAKICPGVRLGDGVVVAMGSVVTKDFPDYSIIGGNPAKVIGSRKEVESFKALLKSESYYIESKR
ncbi:maltose O-acetyltransferase [Pseudoalteromonas rubra]|uniref:Maltose O-acetyltransferase n=1 Tax=Pseudoalteromonas rubra TaxID=43658 RepID=A0A8T0CD63_9GAMM|nr:acyltransferase [Pseudoalteromonas rubra]KAF7788308.1 maltose O-acetyltransferase [Pseudoalteromonas rubra]